MGRGLGTQQRAVLAALRTLDEVRGPGWHMPADVIAVLVSSRPVLVPVVPSRPPELPADPIEEMRLARFRTLIRQGYREYAADVMLIEQRREQRRQALRERWEADRAAARRRKAESQAPNLRRPEPRGGEEGNPSRVLALLARRGLVERQAHCGPGSAVRLVVVPEAMP